VRVIRALPRKQDAGEPVESSHAKRVRLGSKSREVRGLVVSESNGAWRSLAQCAVSKSDASLAALQVNKTAPYKGV